MVSCWILSSFVNVSASFLSVDWTLPRFWHASPAYSKHVLLDSGPGFSQLQSGGGFPPIWDVQVENRCSMRHGIFMELLECVTNEKRNTFLPLKYSCPAHATPCSVPNLRQPTLSHSRLPNGLLEKCYKRQRFTECLHGHWLSSGTCSVNRELIVKSILLRCSIVQFL